MDSIRVIAEKFANGGKVTTTEARRLAHEFLYLRESNESMGKTIEHLNGGQEETVKSLRVNDVRVFPFRCADGTYASSDKTYSDLNDLLGKGFNVAATSWISEHYQISGTRTRIDLFLKLIKLLNQVIQAAYNEGYQDGKNLLLGLAKGTLSLDEFNNPAARRR